MPARPFKKYQILGRFWRADWALLGRAVLGWRADLGLVPAGVWRVRRRRSAYGADRHGRARRPPDRAADRVDHVHGALRHLDGGNGPRRSCRRPRRYRRHAPGRACGADARDRLHGHDDGTGGARPQPHPGAVPRRIRRRCRRDGDARGNAAAPGREFFRRRRDSDSRRRCVARTERYPRAADLCCDLLLGDRIRRLLRFRLHARLGRVSVSGSGFHCRSCSTRRCWYGASTC